MNHPNASLNSAYQPYNSQAPSPEGQAPKSVVSEFTELTVSGRELNQYSYPSSQPVSVSSGIAPTFQTAAQFRSNFEEKEFKFNLFGALEETPGGQVAALDVETLPSLQGSGISQSLFVIQPCGINLPHIHPRATEVQTVIEGEDVLMGFVEENANRRPVFNVLGEGESTFYPQGLTHFQFNKGCKPAKLLSSLNNEDPGVNTVLTNLFQEGVDVQALATSFGVDDVNLIKQLIGSVPQASPAEGIVKACLKRCNGYDAYTPAITTYLN